MRQVIQGVPALSGVAIGRAVVMAASTHGGVQHHFIPEQAIAAEIERVGKARDAVVAELHQLQKNLPKDTPPELSALLDVHTMLLLDEEVEKGVKYWISERYYNGEWALTTQLEILTRQFEAMPDSYLRERKLDLEQIVERVLLQLRGPNEVQQLNHAVKGGSDNELPLILVAHDLSPADMLQFRDSVFVGFVTSVGGQTSHTAIVARSMNIPAVVGASAASQVIQQDDVLVIDGESGVVIVRPNAADLQAHRIKQSQAIRTQQQSFVGFVPDNSPCLTKDGQAVTLLANIENPIDVDMALQTGAAGVGLFRSEFLFMQSKHGLPDEERQFEAYRSVVEGMRGYPVTIRSVDIGADKVWTSMPHRVGTSALGLRAIRWSLSEPEMFLTQVRAILRASAFGPVQLLLPMVAHAGEVRSALALIEQARAQLSQRGQAFDKVAVGAMIEVPAAALNVHYFLRYFDFLSIGTNDLVQYILAIDRTDESVAYLYDPVHPAVLRLLAEVIAAGKAAGKPVSVCGEMAGEPLFTRLLLGLGLRSFSMHSTRLSQVRQELLKHDTATSAIWAQSVMRSDDPQKELALTFGL